MRIRCAALLLAVACVALGPRGASAGIITLEGSGTIGRVTDPLGQLGGLQIGTSFTLTFTVETTTVGIDRQCGGPAFSYLGAVTKSTLRLGNDTYTSAAGDIYTNSDMPFHGCPRVLGEVQVWWTAPWIGGPILFAGPMILGLYDPQAIDGSLPSFNGTHNAVLDYYGSRSQFGGSVPALAPVPEPASLLLLGIGLAGIAARRRASRL